MVGAVQVDKENPVLCVVIMQDGKVLIDCGKKYKSEPKGFANLFGKAALSR